MIHNNGNGNKLNISQKRKGFIRKTTDTQGILCNHQNNCNDWNNTENRSVIYNLEFFNM